MPHLQFETNFAATPAQKQRFAANVIRHFSSIMDTGTDHIAVTLRCFAHEDLAFGRAGPAGRTAFVNADIRVGRTREQKRRLALAFIDEYNRLQIANEGEELWRSSTSVGGSYMTVELVGAVVTSRMDRSKFFKIEPTPLAVDLDGDGVDELIVPQNLVREGLLAVVFKGPAGFRLQSINSGFEGAITSLGAYRTEDLTQPTIIASVVRYSNVLLKAGGETQIIMTVPQD